MFANMDAEADLGSNYDAVGAKPLPGSTEYVVTFSKPSGHCAAAVQPGEAGSDPVDFVETRVAPEWHRADRTPSTSNWV